MQPKIRNLVSVCIPCHNAAPYVSAALDSVLGQTWEDVEIIVVDDASSDGSAELIEAYRSKGVKVIHAAYGNAAKARNRAFSESTGSYIKFFDADDLLSPQMIELQMGRLNGESKSIASSEWGRFYGADISTFKLNPESVWKDLEATQWLVEAWKDARPMMQTGMFLIPREVIERVGGWDESLTVLDDFEFFARLISSVESLLFTKGAILYYRSGLANSLSGKRGRQAAESVFNSFIRGTDHLLAQRDDSEARRSCANILQDFIYTFYPEFPALRKEMSDRIHRLGGSELHPCGSANYQRIRNAIGWKGATIIQRLFRKFSRKS